MTNEPPKPSLPKIIFVTAVLWLSLAAIKVVFLKVFDISVPIFWVLYIFATGIIAMAMVRRVGVLNFLEAFTIDLVWLAVFLLLDFIILVLTLNMSLFGLWQYWAGWVVFLISIFFFHKKRHIHIRKQLAHHHKHH